MSIDKIKASRAIRKANPLGRYAQGGEVEQSDFRFILPEDYAKPDDPLGSKRWDPYGNNTNYDQPIKSYKVDYKTGKLETLPTTFSKYGVFPYGKKVEEDSHWKSLPGKKSNHMETMASILRAVHASQKHGGPKVSPEDMVSLLNQEGRQDFGTSFGTSIFKHDKKAVQLAEKLQKEGFSDIEVILPAGLLAAQNTAKRLNIPWQKVWNGTGSAPVWGNKGETAVFKGITYNNAHMHGGSDYVNEFELNKKAASDPKNADILSFVQKNMSDPPNLDVMNQQEYALRQKSRQDFLDNKVQENSQYNDSNRYGLTTYGPEDLVTHAYNAAKQGRNPFYWTDQDIEARERKSLQKRYPEVVSPKTSTPDLLKARGGAVHQRALGAKLFGLK